jgi:hypothetical protein
MSTVSDDVRIVAITSYKRPIPRVLISARAGVANDATKLTTIRSVNDGPAQVTDYAVVIENIGHRDGFHGLTKRIFEKNS